MNSNELQDDRGMIPDLIKIGSIPSDLSVEVDTDVLDPVVISDKFCRFVLNNKGFLHSFSKIVLAVESDATTDPATFPAVFNQSYQSAIISNSLMYDYIFIV